MSACEGGVAVNSLASVASGSCGRLHGSAAPHMPLRHSAACMALRFQRSRRVAAILRNSGGGGEKWPNAPGGRDAGSGAWGGLEHAHLLWSPTRFSHELLWIQLEWRTPSGEPPQGGRHVAFQVSPKSTKSQKSKGRGFAPTTGQEEGFLLGEDGPGALLTRLELSLQPSPDNTEEGEGAHVQCPAPAAWAEHRACWGQRKACWQGTGAPNEWHLLFPPCCLCSFWKQHSRAPRDPAFPLRWHCVGQSCCSASRRALR